VALVEPPTVAVTSTTPVPGGLVAVQLVVLAQLTPLAGALPKLMDVPFVDGSKLVPVTVTRVPPDDGPETGDTEVTRAPAPGPRPGSRPGGQQRRSGSRGGRPGGSRNKRKRR